jgi:hypothetical protein
LVFVFMVVSFFGFSVVVLVQRYGVTAAEAAD